MNWNVRRSLLVYHVIWLRNLDVQDLQTFDGAAIKFSLFASWRLYAFVFHSIDYNFAWKTDWHQQTPRENYTAMKENWIRGKPDQWNSFCYEIVTTHLSFYTNQPIFVSMNIARSYGFSKIGWPSCSALVFYLSWILCMFRSCPC